jgi:hypothetical protein
MFEGGDSCPRRGTSFHIARKDLDLQAKTYQI